MARKPTLRDQDYANIAIAYKAMPHEKTETIRRRAIELSKRELGLSTVQAELARLRREHPKFPLDMPWSLASLKEYPVDVFTINFLLHTQAIYKQYLPALAESFKKGGYPPPETGDDLLTIRVALWISRLLQTFGKRKGDIIDKPSTNESLKIEWLNLISAANWYSVYEMACELAQVPIDTRHFDAPTLDEINRNIRDYFKTES